MGGITPIHWKKFEKFILFLGCNFEREKGDHRIYGRKDLKRPVVFPRDTQMPVFIIKNNLRLLGISVQEYLEILKRVWFLEQQNTKYEVDSGHTKKPQV